MLTILRKGATSWVAQFFILLLSMSFGFVGIQGIFRYAGDKPVAVVGSTRIEAQAFGTEFKREIERMRKSFGAGFDANQAKQLGLDRQVLDRMIATTVLEQRARDIGLTVGDAGVVARIQSEPIFQGVAGFDRMQFEVLLRNNNFSEAMFVNMIRGDMLRAQLIDAFRYQPAAPTAMAEPLFRRQREERIAQYFVVTDKAIGAVAAPTAEQIDTYYHDHEAQFSAPEYRRLSYLDLSSKDMTAQVQVSDEELASAYESHKDEYAIPTRRDVDQFVVSDKPKADAAAAKLAQGGDFAAVALEAAGIKAGELSLGSVSITDLPPEVASAVFEAPLGKVLGPIETAFGATFVRATKETPGTTKTLEQVKPELGQKLALEKATDVLYEVVRKIEDRRSGGESVSTIAKDLKLTLNMTEPVDAQGLTRAGKPATGLPADPKFLTDGFQLEADHETDLVESSAGHFLLIRAEEVTPSALKPLDQVRNDVITAWTAQARAARLKALADELLAKAKASGELAKAAADVKASVKSSKPLVRGKADDEIGNEVPSALFNVTAGGFVSGAAPAGAGYVVARLERIVPVDLLREAAGLKAAKDDLAKAMAVDLLDQYQAMLRVKYDVSTNEQSLNKAVGASNSQ